ncbi:MAG: protein kinase domain-containing protein [Phycisphaerales bacterium]
MPDTQHPASIGPYSVLRELGRGGMGVVYLARDPKLDRDVAIKALPALFAQEPARLERFQREAKALAALNHPGIAAIYGLEEVAGARYLILEYVDGETLADRLATGPLPLDEALPLARQLAEALEAAHEKGIVHHDLKPANLIITPEGRLKVLDFGLARGGDSALPSSTGLPYASPDSPTLTTPARPINSPTIAGAIMGTAGYMSPEQARGKQVDKRSDIFSFGCVLYEMLSGAQPFGGETVTDALGATLHREPDWVLLPPGTPARVRELLANCLAKDKKNRLHDIGDARLELERAITGREWLDASDSTTARTSRVRPATVAGVALLMLAVGGLLGALFMRPAPMPPPQPFHLSVATPAKPELNDFFGISPDGRFIVYRVLPELEADSPKPGGLMMVRRLDSDKAEPIPGTEGVQKAALSPDGRWVAFVAAKDRARTKVYLKKVALNNGEPTGTPETLCELPATTDANLCWSSDREIAIAQQWNRAILTVPASGGEPKVVFSDEDATGFTGLGEIRPLVPGQSILSSRGRVVRGEGKAWVDIVELASGKRTTLIENASDAKYLPTGHIIARRNRDSLIAARFDLASQKIVGEPVTVWNGKLGGSFFVSPTGDLAMLMKPEDITGRTLAWIDETGRPVPVGAPPRAYRNVRVSPDGGRVVTNFESTEPGSLGSDLWIYDFSRRTFSRLPTQGPAWDHIWSTDGQRIVHNLVAEDEMCMVERRADGSGEPEKLFAVPRGTWLIPLEWSPDGKTLAFYQRDLSNPNGDVLILEKDAAGGKWIATPYLNSPAHEFGLSFSPDGKWGQFISGETGRGELYVQRFTGAGAGAADARSGRIQISTATGVQGGGWWSPDGKEIRFLDVDLQVFSVQIQTEPTLAASVPKLLFSMKDLQPRIRNGVFAPDGRLLDIMKAEDEGKNRLDVIVNFADEMRAKVDAAK